MQVVHEGQLKGAFRGFRNRYTVFEFIGGSKWQQREHKYQYYYAYSPMQKSSRKVGFFTLKSKEWTIV